MNSYLEKEIKVLNVDVQKLCNIFEGMGAVKVYDAPRTRLTFDNNEKTLLKNGIDVRITEENEIKLSLDEDLTNGEKNTIKVRISRIQEMIDILSKLNIIPVSKVLSHRISYEWGKIDFDIDSFPEIPPFLEIDIEHLEISTEELLNKLDLAENEVFTGGTRALYKRYGKNYEEIFKI